LETDRLLKSALASSTQASYQAALNKFNKFLTNYKIPQIFPIPVDQLLNFIAFLSLEGASFRTVALYMNGLSYLHKIRGLFDNTKSFVIVKTLEGYRRTNGINKDPRMPITTPILRKLLAELPLTCYSPYEAKFCYLLLWPSESHRSDLPIVKVVRSDSLIFLK
jgi:hypothetical protein